MNILKKIINLILIITGMMYLSFLGSKSYEKLFRPETNNLNLVIGIILDSSVKFLLAYIILFIMNEIISLNEELVDLKMEIDKTEKILLGGFK